VDAPDYSSLPPLTISLGAGDSPDPQCIELVDLLYPIYTKQMDAVLPGYGRLSLGTSVNVLPATYDEWFEAVGYGTRRKVRRAQKGGYTFRLIDRDQHLAELHAINTSMESRQGREMDPKYRVEVKPFGPLPEQTCPRHRLNTYGVFDKEDTLVAYAWIYVTGEMCLYSTLLGHGDHLAEGVMYLLIAGVIEDLIASCNLKYAVYERHWSGTDGLRFFKETMGFKPYLTTFLRGDEREPTKRELAAEAMRDRMTRARQQAGALKRRTRRRLGRIKRRVLARR
jgi:hypothetical protein